MVLDQTERLKNKFGRKKILSFCSEVPYEKDPQSLCGNFHGQRFMMAQNFRPYYGH
jgi:hypothetical protein